MVGMDLFSPVNTLRNIILQWFVVILTHETRLAGIGNMGSFELGRIEAADGLCDVTHEEGSSRADDEKQN